MLVARCRGNRVASPGWCVFTTAYQGDGVAEWRGNHVAPPGWRRSALGWGRGGFGRGRREFECTFDEFGRARGEFGRGRGEFEYAFGEFGRGHGEFGRHIVEKYRSKPEIKVGKPSCVRMNVVVQPLGLFGPVCHIWSPSCCVTLPFPQLVTVPIAFGSVTNRVW